jgi:hypothetical protein
VRWGEEDSTSYVEIKNGKFGCVMEGKRTIPAKYDIENFMEAVNWDGNAYFSDSADFVLSLDGKWGVMNNRGMTTVPFEYDYIRMERSYIYQRLEYAGVEKNGKCAIIDWNGKLVTGFEFDAFLGYYRSTQFMPVFPAIAMKKGDRIVFYDTQTKKIVQAAPEAENVNESVIVYYKNKCGVISRTGDIILPLEYDQIYSADGQEFKECSQPLTVRKGDAVGVWQYGKGMLLPMQYTSARMGVVNGKNYFVVANAPVTDSTLYGLQSADGKLIVPYEYKSIYIYENAIVGAKGNDEYDISPGGKATLRKQ